MFRDMVPADDIYPTRCQILGGLVVLLSGASGCTTAGSQETPTATRAITERRAFSSCLDMPTTVQVRNSEGEPAIRSATYSPPSSWERARWIVTSASEREALDYPTGTTGVEEARQFVDATDLSAQNVLVHQQTFDSCRSVQLEQLMWKAAERTTRGGFEIGMEYDPGGEDGRCPDGDSQYAVATMVRVPADIEEITRFTAGTVSIGRNDC